MTSFIVPQSLKVYLPQVLHASANSSDENQADLLALADRIPVIDGPKPEELAKLFTKLRQFKNNPVYDPEISVLAKKAMQMLQIL